MVFRSRFVLMLREHLYSFESILCETFIVTMVIQQAQHHDLVAAARTYRHMLIKRSRKKCSRTVERRLEWNMM